MVIELLKITNQAREETIAQLEETEMIQETVDPAKLKEIKTDKIFSNGKWGGTSSLSLV